MTNNLWTGTPPTRIKSLNASRSTSHSFSLDLLAKPRQQNEQAGLVCGLVSKLHKTLTWADGEREDPDKVMEKYEPYVSPRKNKRIARFRFHQRVQKEGETFDTFLKDLRLLAMDCLFDNTEDILVDAIISGARHKKVQEMLLNEGQELGLPKSIQIA